MATVQVNDQEDGKDFGPLRIMNLNARKFTIIDVNLPKAEKFNGKDITWLVSFDVKKEPGSGSLVPFKIKIKQRDSNLVYVIKKGNAPAALLDEDEVLMGDPAVGITTK
jgi:hypothetical protein